MWTDPGNIYIAHRHMNVEIRAEAALFPEKECINKIAVAVYTAKEGPVRIQYKCLVPIYVFLEMKLLFPKQNYNVLSPSSYNHISVRDLYMSRIGLPFLLQENMWTDPGNI